MNQYTVLNNAISMLLDAISYWVRLTVTFTIGTLLVLFVLKGPELLASYSMPMLLEYLRVIVAGAGSVAAIAISFTVPGVIQRHARSLPATLSSKNMATGMMRKS